MNGEVYEPPPPHVVLIRSLFYGFLAGGCLGVAVGLLATGSIYAIPIGGLWGAIPGGLTGLVLGAVLWIWEPAVSRRSRAVVSVLAMVLAYLGLFVFVGVRGFELIVVPLIAPAGLAAWFLLPVVLRPKARGEMPRLPGQST